MAWGLETHAHVGSFLLAFLYNIMYRDNDRKRQRTCINAYSFCAANRLMYIQLALFRFPM